MNISHLFVRYHLNFSIFFLLKLFEMRQFLAMEVALRSFFVGQLVYAKIKGHPPWPAVISSIDGSRAKVFYFNWNKQFNLGWIQKTNTRSLSEENQGTILSSREQWMKWNEQWNLSQKNDLIPKFKPIIQSERPLSQSKR